MKRATSLAAVALLWACIVPGAARAEDQELPANPVLVWNALALQAVRSTSAADGAAARAYAMLNVAIYDAVNGIDEATGDARRGHALVSPLGAPRHSSRYAAASAAADTVLRALFPASAATFDAQLATDLAALGNGSRVVSGKNWGIAVGQQVVAARQDDGASPSETQPGGAGPGQFRATWSGAQFRNMAPFAIQDPARYVTSGPAPLTSPEYAAALAEVQVIGNAAIPDADALATFQFWNSAAGTSQPPGEWIKIASIVAAARPLHRSLGGTSRLFALLGMALADVVAPTYETKFRYDHWRPATAIREADTDDNAATTPDPTWAPRAGGIGGTPEHTSGHSAFAGAASTVLSRFFCSDAASFDLASDSTPTVTRHFDSFSATEFEVGRSRVLGGIHFEFSNRAGDLAGRGVAREILASKLLRQFGPTHFGDCPL